jgi:hypothetical protein
MNIDPQARPEARRRAVDNDHIYLRQAMRWLRSARDSEAIAVLLDDLITFVAGHFEAEEGAGGLFEFVLATAPERAAHVAELAAEHASIRDALGRARGMIAPPYGSADEDLLTAITALTDTLAQHERREQRLLQDTLERDTGRGR